MKINVLFRWLIVLTAFSLTLSGCKPAETNAPQPTTISQKLLTGSSLGLLRAAITRAGLDASLAQAGGMTIFAPSDSAFITAGYADAAAINNTPVDTLKRLLQYHILNTKLLSSSIAVGNNTPQVTLAGLPVYITKTTTITVSVPSSATASATSLSTVTGRTSINGARLLQTDVEGTNGVIHVIDKLLIPPTGNIVQTLARLSARGPNSFSLLTAAITRSGTTTLLTGAGPYTVFAPTDAGFTTAYSSVSAINAASVTKIAALIGAHTVAGRYFSTTVLPGQVFPGIGVSSYSIYPIVSTGNRLTGIALTGQTGTDNPVKVADIVATNGVIHIVTIAYNLP